MFVFIQRNDLCELQRHIYADTMERMILRKLLQMIFIPCDCLNKKSDVKQEETSTALTSFGKLTYLMKSVMFPRTYHMKSVIFP